MSTELDVLIVGLGNPGPEYVGSRHNIGAACVEELARRLEVRIDRRRWRSRVGQAHPVGREGAVWLMLPQTYMNESGRAVKAAVKEAEVAEERVWVVHDELDLPLCRLRIQRGGSPAGHNGVRSIIGALASDRFVRFRVGVGKPPAAALGRRHVLGRFRRSESAQVEKVVNRVADALETGLALGVDAAMAEFNRAGSLGCEEP